MDKKLIAILLGSIGGAFAFLAFWMVGVNRLANEREAQLDRELQNFMVQFPKIEANDSARRLNDLTAALGIGLAFKSPNTLDSAPDKMEDFEQIREELDRFLEAELEKKTESVSPAPESLRGYLETRKAELEAIRSHLLNSELPIWERDLERWLNINHPTPSLLGILNLQKLLILDVLDKNSLGQTRAGEQSLEASWKLNQTLWDRPDLISQLSAILVARLQVGALRKMDGLPTQWQERAIARDYQKLLLTSLELESWLNYGLVKLPQMAPEQGGEKLAPLEGLYIRLSGINTSQNMRQGFAKLEFKNICSFDVEALQQQMTDSIASWNQLGQIAMPNLAGQWRKAGKMMLDWELTQKILQVKALAAEQGTWPEKLPDLESKVCPGQRWIYQVAGDRSISLSFSKNLDWLELQENSIDLPLTYSMPPRLGDKGTED